MKLATNFFNKVWISGSQFAVCYRVLVISEWPLVIFSKIENDQKIIQNHSAVLPISSSSYSPLQSFSWSFLSTKMNASRHTLRHLKVLLITVYITNTCYLFAKPQKFFSCGGIFPCFALFFVPNLLFVPNSNHDQFDQLLKMSGW